jgi:predicted transcriptional regulator
MEIQEIVKFLQDNYYIIKFDNKIVVTNKFKREFNNPGIISIGVKAPMRLPAVKPTSLAVKVPTPLETKVLYKQFIKEAEVPTYLPLSNGGKYAANRYSNDASKVFAIIVRDSNIDKRALLLATKLYYKQSNLARQTISNYFTQGTWESVYEEFMERVDQGNVAEYIQKNLKESNGESNYEQGI